jgi:hypothetical protein
VVSARTDFPWPKKDCESGTSMTDQLGIHSGFTIVAANSSTSGTRAAYIRRVENEGDAAAPAQVAREWAVPGVDLLRFRQGGRG